MHHFSLLPIVPDARRRIIAHVIEADLAWFARHPDRCIRARLYIPGEAGSLIPADAIVDDVLCFIRDGHLVRLYLRVAVEEEHAA
jgi:hypothetical protein